MSDPKPRVLHTSVDCLEQTWNHRCPEGAARAAPITPLICPCQLATYHIKSGVVLINGQIEIAKADESLKAAEHCYKESLYNSSVSRAYYSMYQAAQVALEAVEFVRAEWTHGGLQATFANELTRRRKLYSPFVVRGLNIVQDLRHTADYRDSDVSRRQATRALAKAREFISQIKKGLSHG